MYRIFARRNKRYDLLKPDRFVELFCEKKKKTKFNDEYMLRDLLRCVGASSLVLKPTFTY